MCVGGGGGGGRGGIFFGKDENYGSYTCIEVKFTMFWEKGVFFT